MIKCIWEHNGNDTLLHIENYVGAFTRGQSLDIAMGKVNKEIIDYCKWANISPPEDIEIKIIQDYSCKLNVCDADSDVLFESEKKPLTWQEYETLKALCLKSALDFLELYNSIPDKDYSNSPNRKTFYGTVPRTANEMYEHTQSVNDYYFGEIGINADNEGDIYACRKRGFELLENTPDFLDNKLFNGSYNELWTLRKMLRRFIWHDRIHAKAMRKLL